MALAQAAARLLAEGSTASIAAARQKAAERLGAPDSRAWPSNQEVSEALADYQRLFGGRHYDERLQRLRATALQAMKLLEGFSPRLVGPVLSGTATATSPVNLHVFCDTSEAVGLFLEDHGIPCRLGERALEREPGSLTTRPVYTFIAGETAIELVVFPRLGLRQAPLSSLDGRPMPRADRAAVEALLEAAPGGTLGGRGD